MFHALKWLRNKVISIFNFFGETNMIFEFVPEMPYRCRNRPCCCVTKRTDCIPFNFSLDVPKQIDIFFAAVTVFYSV